MKLNGNVKVFSTEDIVVKTSCLYFADEKFKQQIIINFKDMHLDCVSEYVSDFDARKGTKSQSLPFNMPDDCFNRYNFRFCVWCNGKWPKHFNSFKLSIL